MTRHALHYGSGRRGRPIAAATPEPHALPETVAAAVDAAGVAATAGLSWPPGSRREGEESESGRLAGAGGARSPVPGKTRAVDPDGDGRAGQTAAAPGPRMRGVRRRGLSASPALVPRSRWVPSTVNTPRPITRHYPRRRQALFSLPFTPSIPTPPFPSTFHAV